MGLAPHQLACALHLGDRCSNCGSESTSRYDLHKFTLRPSARRHAAVDWVLGKGFAERESRMKPRSNSPHVVLLTLVVIFTAATSAFTQDGKLHLHVNPKQAYLWVDD